MTGKGGAGTLEPGISRNPDPRGAKAMEIHLGVYDSPLGPLEVAVAGQAVVRAAFVEERPGPSDDHPVLAHCLRELDEYFAGRRSAFTVPLDPAGTPFQLAVWEAVRAVPCGRTESYRDLAERLGRTGAARAVGAAVARNPLAILIPCHRVVGADGELTGYAWGIWRKERLLRVEQVIAGR
jgi:methylated-DNA-[protein]-cysteine S-methyltransferase